MLAALLGLFGLYHLAIQPALTELATGVPFINSYGRQRMLSQRLLKTVLAVQYPLPAADRARLQAELSQTLAEWVAQHEQLMQSDSSYVRSAEIGPALGELNAHFQSMRTAGEKILRLVGAEEASAEIPHEDELRELTAGLLAEEPQFLTQMHHIVELFQAEVQRRVRELRLVGWAIFLTLLAVAAFLHAGIISPAIRALGSLYQSNLSRYETLVENMQEGLALVDGRGYIQFANRRLTEILQLAELPPNRFRLTDLVDASPGVVAATADALREQRPIEIQVRRKSDFAPLDLNIRCQSILTNGKEPGSTTLVVMTDVTAENSARERTRALQDQLSRLQRLHTVGEMSASLAHELGQPLSAIAAYAGACRQKLRSDDVDATALGPLLDRIDRAATRAGHVLKRFRAFGRNAPMTLASVDMSTVLQELQELCGPLLADAGITLHTEIHPVVPAIAGDTLLLQQVLINLVRNSVEALQHAPAERKTIDVMVRAEDLDGGVCIVVADAGAGISAELLPKLAEPFFTTRDTGLGLGLSICRTIMENHGGRMTITSAAGEGTTVRLHLPAASQEVSCA